MMSHYPFNTVDHDDPQLFLPSSPLTSINPLPALSSSDEPNAYAAYNAPSNQSMSLENYNCSSFPPDDPFRRPTSPFSPLPTSPFIGPDSLVGFDHNNNNNNSSSSSSSSSNNNNNNINKKRRAAPNSLRSTPLNSQMSEGEHNDHGHIQEIHEIIRMIGKINEDVQNVELHRKAWRDLNDNLYRFYPLLNYWDPSLSTHHHSVNIEFPFLVVAQVKSLLVDIENHLKKSLDTSVSAFDKLKGFLPKPRQFRDFKHRFFCLLGEFAAANNPSTTTLARMAYRERTDDYLKPSSHSSMMNEQQDGLVRGPSFTSAVLATTSELDRIRSTTVTTTTTTTTTTSMTTTMAAMVPNTMLQRNESKPSSGPRVLPLHHATPPHIIKQFIVTESELAEQADRTRKNEDTDKCTAVLEAQNLLQALEMNNGEKKIQEELTDLISKVNNPSMKDDRASFREVLARWEERKFDPDTKYEIFRAATNPENPCLPALGMCFLYGIASFSDKSDKSIGHKILQECYHKLGIRECAVLLGQYEDSMNNHKNARKYYQEGAKHGCTYSQNGLAMDYIQQDCKSKKKEGFDLLYSVASKTNSNVAKYNLATAYSRGDGVERNTDQYWHWLNQAAKYGSVEAQFVLGEHYETGKFVKHHKPSEQDGVHLSKSALKAFEFFQQSAEGGYPQAVLRLIQNYKTSLNETELFHWYTRAAELGDKYSQFKLGGYYELGKNNIVEINIRTALYWYSRCITECSIPDVVCLGQVGIGRCYETMGDIQEAIAWYEASLSTSASLAASSEAESHYNRLICMTKK